MPAVIYRASTDPVHFPEGATVDEQEAALRTLGVAFDSTTWETGRHLDELLEAVQYHGDTLPGRTAAESIKMVSAAVKWKNTRNHERRLAAMKWENKRLWNRVLSILALTVALGMLASTSHIIAWANSLH